MQLAYMAACSEGVERGAEVPFAFRPLMTTVTIQTGFSEAVEVQKLVLSSDDPVAGAFTYDVATGVCTTDPGKTSRVLAVHLTTGAVPYSRLDAGS